MTAALKSAEGKDLSSLWHAFAPPPPPPSGGTSAGASPSGKTRATQADPRRRSASYYHETSERSRGDALPASSFSPAPERPLSRNQAAKTLGRSVTSASQAAGKAGDRNSMPVFVQQQYTAAESSQAAASARPASMYAAQSPVPPAPRQRHESTPAQTNGGPVDGYWQLPDAAAAVQNGYARAASPAPNYIPGAAPVQRSHSMQNGAHVVSPAVYAVPQSNFPQASSPISPAHSPAQATSPLPPQPGVYPVEWQAQQPAMGYAVHPQHAAYGIQPAPMPYAAMQAPAGHAPVYTQPPPAGAYYYIPAGQSVPVMASPVPPHAAVPHPQAGQPMYQVLQQEAPGMIPQYAGYAPAPAHSHYAYQQPAAPEQAQAMASIPSAYAISASALANAVPNGAGSIPSTPATSSRPLPQPVHTVPVTTSSVAATSATPSSPTNSSSMGSLHSSSGSIASSVGSIRRSLPQPPPGVSPAFHAPPAMPPGANLQGTLGRNESVRVAAEALMARGVPRRPGVGLGTLRSRMAAASAAANASMSAASAPPAQGQSAAQQDRSPPQTIRMQAAPAPEVESVTQTLQDITLQSRANLPQRPQELPQEMQPHELAKQLPSNPSPGPREAPPSAADWSADQAAQLPERPRSRGAHHTISRGDPRNVACPPAAYAGPATVGPSFRAPPGASIPRVVSPKPRAAIPQSFAPEQAPVVPVIVAPEPAVQVSAPVSPAPARYQPQRRALPPQPVALAPPAVQVTSAPVIVEPPKPKAVQPAPPMIVLPGDDEEDAGPSIVIDAPSVPTISIGGDDNDGDDGPSAGPMISVTSDDGTSNHSRTSSTSQPGVPQRATASYARPPPNSSTGAASASSMGSGATCGGCRKWIGGRVVQAMDVTWHAQCFQCSHCGEHLEHVAFYEHEGRPYCHFDYHELFSRRCFHCRTPIVDERFIAINDEQLGKRYYHDLHFFCANCGDPFVDPKAAAGTAGADEQALIADEDGIVQAGGKAFVVVKGYPYCEKCHINVHHPRCKGCRKPITDDLITALNGKWHPQCFVCESCKRPFEGERFFEKDGKAWDEECCEYPARR